jgi:uncharacterized protein YkwD
MEPGLWARIASAFANTIRRLTNPNLRPVDTPGPLPTGPGRRHPYLLPIPPPPDPTPAGIDPIATPSPFAAELAGAINRQRIAMIKKSLTINPALCGAARWIAEDNARTGVLSHTGSDGSDCGQRAARAGYVWGWVAENGDEPLPGATPVQVVQDWMASTAGHREHLLASQPTEMGVGEAMAGVGRRFVFLLLVAKPR